MPSAKKTEKKDTTDDNQDDKKKRVRHSYLYATGRRKSSVARVRLYKKGEGKITVNEKPSDEYFHILELQQIVKAPLEVINKKDIDFTIKVTGGGIRGQAEAARHGISRALIALDKDYRATLKPEGFLKRDSRMKERKKPGLKRARKSPQWSKR